MRLLIVPVFFLFASAANATTMEQVAAATGQLEAGYNRAKLLCAVAGISMVTFENHNPDTARVAAQMKAEYAEAYAIGAAKGVRQANNMLEDKRDIPEMCAKFRTMGKK
jgi:hypothetical protein